VAAIVGVSEKKLRSWENDKSIPTNAEWNLLLGVLPLSPEGTPARAALRKSDGAP